MPSNSDIMRSFHFKVIFQYYIMCCKLQSSIVNIWFSISQLQNTLHANKNDKAVYRFNVHFKSECEMMKSHQVRGNNLGIYLPRTSSHTCSFQDYIVLFWFFFFILGQDETSSWGIWKNSPTAININFNCFGCPGQQWLLWVFGCAVHFMCCESCYVALFCDSDCDFVITFARTKWQHSCFIQ